MQASEYKTSLQLARKIIAAVPHEKQDVLAAAYERYMCFCGVNDPEPGVNHVAEDRTVFHHLLVYAENGDPLLSDERCADFMVAVSGLPREWCLAWDEVAFADEHGEDFVENQTKRQESNRLEVEMAAALGN